MSRINIAETIAAQSEQIALNTRAGIEAAARVEASIACLRGELVKANEIAEKTARYQEEMAIRARISDEEKQEQKEIKSAVFSFKQDLEVISKGSGGLKRYVGLKKLSDVGKTELAHYIGKLIELNDKEFANDLLNAVYDLVKESFRLLTDVERDDLRKIELFTSAVLVSENEINRLAESLQKEQENLSMWQSALVTCQQEFERIKKLPSRLSAFVRLLLIFFISIWPGMFFPFLLLLFGGVRGWVGKFFKVVIYGAKLANDAAETVSATQSQVLKQEEVCKSLVKLIDDAKIKLAASQQELVSLFSKHNLSIIEE